MTEPPIDPPPDFWIGPAVEPILCEVCGQVIEPKSFIAEYSAITLAHLECAHLTDDFVVKVFE